MPNFTADLDNTVAYLIIKVFEVNRVQAETVRPFLPHDTIFLPADTGMYIRRHERILILNGKGIYAMFHRLAPFLDGTRRLDQLCDGLPAVKAAAIRQLLISLIDKKVLISRSGADYDLLSESEHTRHASQVAFLEHLVEHPAEAFLRFRNARIYLRGDGMACQAAGLTLLRNGLSKLFLASDMDPGIAVVLKQTSEELCQGEIAASVVHLDGNFESGHARHEFDYVCYVSDRPNFAELAVMALSCRRTRTTLLPAIMVAGSARIGPLPSTSGQGCWNCSFLRLLNHVRPPLAAQLWRHRALGESCNVDVQHPSAPILQIMGSGAAFHLFHHACGLTHADSAVGNSIESISSLTLESTSGLVLAHPDCTICHVPQLSAYDNVPAADTPLVEKVVLGADFGLFACFRDDELKQIPVFQSRLQLQHYNPAFLPGNSLGSNALARREALLEGAVRYTMARHEGRRLRLCANDVSGASATLLTSSSIVGVVPDHAGGTETRSWLPGIGVSDGSAFLLPESAVFGAAGIASEASEMPSGVAAGYAFDEAKQRAISSLLTHEGLKAVVSGAIVPRLFAPTEGGPAYAAYFDLLRQNEPSSTAWVFSVDTVWVALIGFGNAADGPERLLVGHGESLQAALDAALTEALAVSVGGASARSWANYLPPNHGYGLFQQSPASVSDRSHISLAELAKTSAHQVAELICCDVTPNDLRQVGLLVFKALLVRCNLAPPQADVCTARPSTSAREVALWDGLS